MGCRTTVQRYNFESIADYLRLCGLLIDDETVANEQNETTTDATTEITIETTTESPNLLRTEEFSNIKTTNCNHLIFYPYQTREYHIIEDGQHEADATMRRIEESNRTNLPSTPHKPTDLSAENKWPPVFLLKRSLEMHEAHLDVQSLVEIEIIEMERSDNNLGAALVRKVCRRVELVDELHRQYTCRIAIYSILDEYQQIRYELAIESELGELPERTLCRSPFRNFFDRVVVEPNGPVCALSRDVHRFSDTTIYENMDAMYGLVKLVTEQLEFTERTMIQLNIDWIPNDLGTPIVSSTTTAASNGDDEHADDEEDENGTGAGGNNNGNGNANTGSSTADTSDATSARNVESNNQLSYNTRLLSYVLPPEHAASVENFVQFVRQRIANRVRRREITVRPKINGVRLYASFDGRDKLYCDNGEVVRLNGNNPRGCFSTDMIYQLERVNATIDGTTIINCELDVRYVLTEVIVVRNSFACQLNALSQSFSPSNLPYSYGDEQQWPYGLDATGLSPHETLAVLQFWSLSACSAAGTSNLVKRFIETLRRRETANQANQTNQTNQTQQSQTQQSQQSQQVSRKNSHESRQLQPQQSNDRIYHTHSAQTNDTKNSSGPNCPNTDPTDDSITDTQKPNTNTKEDRNDQNENNGNRDNIWKNQNDDNKVGPVATNSTKSTVGKNEPPVGGDDDTDDAIELHPDPNELDMYSDTSDPDELSSNVDSVDTASIISPTDIQTAPFYPPPVDPIDPLISVARAVGRRDPRDSNDPDGVASNQFQSVAYVCAPCRKSQRDGLRNTGQSFAHTRGKNWDNQNFITVPMNDSFTLVNRLHTALVANNERHLVVNRAVTDERELIERAGQFYRHYVLRLCDILFLSRKHELCYTMLQKHFPRDEVERYANLYRDSRNLRDGIANRFAETLPIDGFLLYVPSLESNVAPTHPADCQAPLICRPKARNTCAVDMVRRSEQRNCSISAFKLKPYQSIELLLEISKAEMTGSRNAGSSSTLSSWSATNSAHSSTDSTRSSKPAKSRTSSTSKTRRKPTLNPELEATPNNHQTNTEEEHKSRSDEGSKKSGKTRPQKQPTRLSSLSK